MKSVFREAEWRKSRHFLNPSKWKEYELHVSGLGFLNRLNFLSEHVERFTHIDTVTEEELVKLHRKSKVHVIRKELSSAERSLLEKHGFRLDKVWGTLILDMSKELQIDKGNRSIIRKGERLLSFHIVDNLNDFKAYYQLFKGVRREEGLKTASFDEYLKVFGNRFYKVFVAKLEGRIVAGIGTIFNENYMLQLNIARDKKHSYAADYLTFMIIKYCKDKGIKWFDFAGVDPAPKEHSKDYFIRKYKEKWGGEFFNEYVFRR